MSHAPAQPMIYHITHVNNLRSIVTTGKLLSDTQIISLGGPSASIGMSEIKQRRLTLPVKCHPGTFVGEYVPFYFCPRSVMLYVINRANHPELQFQGGQDDIVHIEANLYSVVDWANSINRPWAISLSNAGAYYTEFYSCSEDLSKLDWAAIANTDFRNSDVKESKQAEFLVYESLPWSLVNRIGVKSKRVQSIASKAISLASHIPPIVIKNDWYF